MHPIRQLSEPQAQAGGAVARAPSASEGGFYAGTELDGPVRRPDIATCMEEGRIHGNTN